MLEKIRNKHIAVITAHPDDESVLAGGTIATHVADGGKVSLFCASSGEKGSAHVKKNFSESLIIKIRRKELKAAAKYLGIQKVDTGTLPDSKIKDYKKELTKQISKFILKTKPDIVISFGPDGFTGHADHIAVGEVAEKIAKQKKIVFWRFTKPPKQKCPGLESYLIKKRKNGSYVKDTSNSRGNIFSVKVDPKRKMRTLKIFKTQFEGINPYNVFPKKIAKHMLNREYFSL